MKPRSKAYSDGPGVAEKDDHALFMADMRRLANAQGLSLDAWMRNRDAYLQAKEDSESARYGNMGKAIGPVLDGSESWHRDYVEYCRSSAFAIIDGKAKPYSVALHVLNTWGAVLSQAAVVKWTIIADGAEPVLEPVSKPRSTAELSQRVAEIIGPYVGPHTRRPINHVVT